MSKREFEYIKPLREKPTLKSKTGKVSISQKIISEFLKANVDYAEITYKEKTPRALLIGMGRYISKQGIKDVEARISADGKAILIKKK